jgi:CheY-like chemotaxis protein
MLGHLVGETIELRFKSPVVLPLVHADPSMIEQVVMNLASNARDAMPGGGTLIIGISETYVGDEHVEAHPESAPGHFVKLEVTDTGCGMDEATRARIFEPFFTTKPTGHGTGLGLASAYAIVKNHGGAITVESAPGAGSTFTVHLPAREAPPAAEPRRARTVRRGRETILVVDDEAVVLKAYGRLLRKLGYQVLTATDGEEALAVYREHGAAIALVLLDMVMPGQGGGATLDALKAHDPQVKVLLCSGYGLDGEAEEILARGCAGFIQKPFSPEALSGKLRELLGRGTGG